LISESGDSSICVTGRKDRKKNIKIPVKNNICDNVLSLFLNENKKAKISKKSIKDDGRIKRPMVFFIIKYNEISIL
jgi:hypothetical protein